MIPKELIDRGPFQGDRRDFLKTSAVGLSGLVFGVQFGCSEPKKLTGNPDANFSPNVYLAINGLGDVTIMAHRSEMGTGIRTSLPLVIADELEADWNRVKLVQAEGDEKYGDQNTDGSYSVRMFYMPLRRAGAAARMMLEQAAANEWQVDVSECKAKNHEVIHTSGKAFGFGYLAEKAAELDVPEESSITLKDPEDFKFITRKTSIYDLEDIVTGKGNYGLDTKVEGCKVAVIFRPPVDGGSVKNFDGSAAMEVPGVLKVFQMESPGFPTTYHKPLGGVAVVAENTWSALKGREALQVDWDGGSNGDYNSTEYLEGMVRKAESNGRIRREQGSIKKALADSPKLVKATYRVPHFSHSPMEAPCAVVDTKASSCEVWAPVQDPQWTRNAVAESLGMDVKDVRVNVTLLGGGFGRKSKPDFVVETALISKEMGAPVKLMWTREDDIQHDFFHFNCAQHVQAGVGDDNKMNAWLHRTVFPTIAGTADPNANEPSGFELSMGVLDFPYDIPNVCCETHESPVKIRIGWLRSVANINHAFAVGCTLDEVAEQRGVDPAQNLIDLIGSDRQIDFNSLTSEFWNYNEKIEDFPWDTGRYRKVVETVRDKSGWGKQMPEGSGMGIAAHRSFLTYVACVVEVKVVNGRINIPNVHYAVDCGVPVNPERIKAQFEGGAAFGASLALVSKITVDKGIVEQTNFDSYRVARINEAPYDTQVHIVESSEKPTGVGEPPVPPLIPALCNAVYAATGQRIRELPIKLA